MRRLLYLTVALALGTAAIVTAVQSQPYYGGPMMGQYGPEYGSGGPGGPGNRNDRRGYGYGMMGPHGGLGYGMMMDRGWGNRRGDERRWGNHPMCWTDTDSNRGYGYYAPCRN
jgi:hypothetical protein